MRLIELWNSNTKIKEKELSLCHNLKFAIPDIFATKCWKPLIFQTMNYVRSKNISLKYQRYTTLG